MESGYRFHKQRDAKLKTIITYGTFDLFHIGHLNLLQHLREMGDRLVVGISTDEFNRIKGKKTIMPFEQRMQIVQAIRYVDEVFPEESWEQKVADVKKYHASVFAIGEDWVGKFDFLKEYDVEVIYLPRTEGISSTQIKDTLKPLSGQKIKEIKDALDFVTSIIETIK